MPYVHHDNHFIAFVILDNADVHVDAALEKVRGALDAFGPQRRMGRIFSQKFQLVFKLLLLLGVQVFLLLKYDGYTYEQVADKLDVCLSAVKSCIQRFIAGGVEAALYDRKGRGRRPEISDSDVAWVIERACEKPKDHGYAAELWYPASFTRFIHSIAEEQGHSRMASVSESTVRRILKSAKLKPFKITYYCEKRDPDSEAWINTARSSGITNTCGLGRCPSLQALTC